MRYRANARALFVIGGALLVWVVAVAPAQPSLAQTTVTIDLQETRYAGEFLVPLNKSQILRLDVPFADLSIGSAEIADVLPLTTRTIYVLGRSLGSTNLSIYGENKSLIAVVDLVVTFDVEGLKRALFEHLPDEMIEVRTAEGSIILNGTVTGAEKLSRVLAVAERFAPGQVTNLLRVRGSQQVMLAVRFAEVGRSLVRELGFQTNIFDPDFPFALATGDGTGFSASVDLTSAEFEPSFDNVFSATSFITGLTLANIRSWGFALAFEALEDKGVVKTLAEPNLIALSGDTASFLAGGEFPIPVAQEDQAITVEFKQFGVSLAFTPTVLDDGLINLVVSPEVSQIDRSISVVTETIEVPGISTRRATTTVELRDGQTFAIAGLLQNDFNDTVRQFPGLGEIPVLGALFRSSDFQRNETELVIIITPHLVKPAPAGSLAAPTDTFIPPSDVDLFLHGRIEAPGSGYPRGAGELLGVQGAGGITGKYGHIIE